MMDLPASWKETSESVGDPFFTAKRQGFEELASFFEKRHTHQGYAKQSLLERSDCLQKASDLRNLLASLKRHMHSKDVPGEALEPPFWLAKSQ